MRYIETEHKKRIRRAFLIFPKKIMKETRWLEIAEWEETYETSWGPGGYSSRWCGLRWINP